MQYKFLFWSVPFMLFFQSCTTQPYAKQHSAFIVFKTPAFKYADMGFVYENSDEVKVEIYSSGQPLVSMKINKTTVCMSLLACMSREAFNEKVLSAQYPGEILEDIFRGKPVLDAKNLEKSRNGFTQNIVNTDKYDIHYSVLNNETVFRDTINYILIKIKKERQGG